MQWPSDPKNHFPKRSPLSKLPLCNYTRTLIWSGLITMQGKPHLAKIICQTFGFSTFKALKKHTTKGIPNCHSFGTMTTSRLCHVKDQGQGSKSSSRIIIKGRNQWSGSASLTFPTGFGLNRTVPGFCKNLPGTRCQSSETGSIKRSRGLTSTLGAMCTKVFAWNSCSKAHEGLQ